MLIITKSDHSGVPIDLWFETCKKSDSATFFHTPLWIGLFTNKLEDGFQKILFSDGKFAVLPLVCNKYLKGLANIYLSSPAGTFGGWVTTDTLTSQHYELLIKYMNHFGDLVWRENPYDSQLKKYDFPNANEDFTYAINLENGYDHVWKTSDYAHKKAYRLAEKSGIVVSASEDPSDWEKYYHMYEKSVSRWKDRMLFSGVYYDFAFINKIRNIEVPFRKLWLAKYEGEPISGIICFYWNKHAVAWHGAGLKEYFNLRPNNLLYATAMKDAAEKGFSWFDCNPSGGLEGVKKFKMNLGAQELRSRVVQKVSPLRKGISRLRNLIKKTKP
jgi:hypothetical protein